MPHQDYDDTDDILSQIETPEEPRAMSEGGKLAETAPETPAAPTWNGQEWEFEAGGRKVVPESRDALIKWAQQGHGAGQRIAEFNRREQEYQRQLADSQKKYGRYAEIDEYAGKNKEWWEHVQQSYANRGQNPPAQGQVDPAFEAALRPLQEKLEAMSSFVTSAQQEKQIQEQQRADEALSAEIEATRSKYPTIDLNAVDETGRTLESRIIDHANKEGISTFRAAFRDYLHDQLVESAKANAQTAKAKVDEHAKKQGLLGKSPAPKKAPSNAPVNHRGKSYDDITADVLAELNIN